MTYFDSKYFASNLFGQITDKELVIDKANTLPKADFIQWANTLPEAELILIVYEDSWFAKEDLLEAMQEQIDDVVRAQNKAKAEILRLKALMA